jgi:hypothetical protein
MLYSQSYVDLGFKNHWNVQYCNDKSIDTNVLITIGAGNILVSDSLYGFDFWIKYDTNKLFFNKPVYQNTLSEFFDEKQVLFDGSTGEVHCWAMNYYKPLAGNIELIGFLGGYKNTDCWDSTLVVFEDYELTEFTRNIKIKDSLWVVPKNRMPDNYNIKVNIISDTLVFDNKLSTNIKSNITNDKNLLIDSLLYNIRFNKNDKYKIINYKSLSDSVVLEKLNDDVNQLILKISFNKKRFSSLNFLEFNVEKMDTNSDNETYMIIEPIKLSNCNCIKQENIKSDSVLMFYKKDTVVSTIHENKELFLVEGTHNGFNIINSKNIEIEYIQLYNFVGRLIESYDVKNHNEKMFYDTNCPPGVYMLNIITAKGVIKKSVLIYN